MKQGETSETSETVDDRFQQAVSSKQQVNEEIRKLDN
jgi:hypothetical protein